MPLAAPPVAVIHALPVRKHEALVSINRGVEVWNTAKWFGCCAVGGELGVFGGAQKREFRPTADPSDGQQETDYASSFLGCLNPSTRVSYGGVSFEYRGDHVLSLGCQKLSRFLSS